MLWIEPRTYLTLTVAGLAMGMLIFLVASGLTLIFGLMDVLNFAHGALFSWGAYAGFSAAVLLERTLGLGGRALGGGQRRAARWPPSLAAGARGHRARHRCSSA